MKNLQIGLCWTLDRDFACGSENDPKKLFEHALEVIEERFPNETIDIRITEDEFGFEMVKERMKPGRISQKKSEDHDTELSILDIEPHHDNGTVLHLINRERIHLTEDTICQIIQAATENKTEEESCPEARPWQMRLKSLKKMFKKK